MDNDSDFSLNNLNTNPSFNFCNSLLNSDLYSLNPHDDNIDDSPYSNLQVQCNYLDENQFASKYFYSNKFSIMSFNIQSLPSKFNEFQELIQNFQINKCEPDIICLQEIWQIVNSSAFSLDDYNPIEYKLRSNSTQGGGVGIYIKKISNITFYVIKVFLLIGFSNPYSLKSGSTKIKKL